MSGHSKWSTIRRKKGAADAKRSQAFTKYANAIAVAAREGADPDTNFKLRLAIDKAKTVNMPIANIDKAIARGSGSAGGAALEQVIYEGYGPGGIAVMVECATDNRNRTAAAVRSIFSKHGGNLAQAGAVAYQFEQKSQIQIETTDTETASLAAIDGGAQDVDVEADVVTIYGAPADFKKLKDNLEAAGYEPVAAELSFVPKQLVSVADVETARKVVKLMEALEDQEDITATYSNFDIPTEILETVAN